MLPRLDIMAFRSVMNRPLHSIVEQVSRVEGKAFASVRSPFEVQRTRPTPGVPGRWVLTYQHMEPEEGTDRREVLWYRLFFEQRADTASIPVATSLRGGLKSLLELD